MKKKQDRSRMVREVHRLHTPVQEAMKMHTGMKKVVLNHFSLYPTMVLLNCVSKFYLQRFSNFQPRSRQYRPCVDDDVFAVCTHCSLHTQAGNFTKKRQIYKDV